MCDQNGPILRLKSSILAKSNCSQNQEYRLVNILYMYCAYYDIYTLEL
jgi:hypothetical protein